MSQRIALVLPDDIAADVGQRAGALGMTSNSYIASRLKLWLDGEDLIDEIEAALGSLSATVEEICDANC